MKFEKEWSRAAWHDKLDEQNVCWACPPLVFMECMDEGWKEKWPECRYGRKVRGNEEA